MFAREILRLLVALMFVSITMRSEAAADAAAPAMARELVFLNWSDYVDPELIHEFERRNGVRVRQVYYETDELLTDMLVEANGIGFDVVVASDTSLRALSRFGWIEPISEKAVPNLRHMDPRWLSSRVENTFGVPYLWGTVGIAYRADLLQRPITSWRQLYSPTADLHGRILMIQDSREVIGMALKALGRHADSNDPQDIADAAELVRAQAPHVGAWSYVSVNEDSALVTGEAWIAMIYNGDAVTLREYHPDIRYVVPEEGSYLWMDNLAILRATKNKALALRFIDFMSEPANAARNAAYLHFATPNRSAERLLPAEFLADPAIYPPKAVLEHSGFMPDRPPKVLRMINTVFSEVTQ
ncbi:MAG: spermidine/putrescine ABC transporter substrate-binding protein [Gammaproteobacteria bacterium]|nr:spermidine/putrescine ABC transporter substrate-binding protein [Gammaproteobacteria bacterium]